MPEAIQTSPLAGALAGLRQVLRVDGRDCTLSEAALQGMLNLRGDVADASFAAAVLQHTGLHLPVLANTASIDPQRQLLWLGPDEWLFKCEQADNTAVANALRQALAGGHVALTDVGHGNMTLCLQGPAAADLLARGCPLDLHPRAFARGAVAQTHVAKAGATVLCLEPGSSFEITVRRSFADYLVRWLISAGD
jgi:sarcosine oxidase subunit gamma